MFLWIALLLVVLWLCGFLVMHISGALLHLLLVVAIVMLILHFVRGGKKLA